MFETIGGKLGSRLLLPGNEQYEQRRKVWNGAIDKRPKAIVVCETEQDVVDAVTFAKEKDLPMSIKGGGHHVAGLAVCDDGIMIDLSTMRHVEVDVKGEKAVVEGGALLADVDAQSQKYGLATPTGTVSETGIAGLALAGGLGYLRGKYGLTSDNVIEANVVTADGNLYTVNENSYPELFWAIRGGGGNFGVVTKFTFQLHSIGPEVLAADLIYDYKDATQLLKKAQAYVTNAPDEVSFNLAMTQLPEAPFLPDFLHNRKVIMLQGLYAGDPKKGEEAIAPLRQLATPIVDRSRVVNYGDFQQVNDVMVEDGIPVTGTSLYLSDLDDQKIDKLLTKLESIPSLGYLVQLWGLSGKMNRVPTDATAFAIRDADFALLVDVMEVPGVDKEACQQWVNSLYNELLPYSHRQSSYLNGIGLNEQITKNAYDTNYQRLTEIKKQYDPNNLFRHNHNIDPNAG